jgi:hypothetical protein
VLVERGVCRKGAKDCGSHEFYNEGDGWEACYHCEVGRRPFDPVHFNA